MKIADDSDIKKNTGAHYTPPALARFVANALLEICENRAPTVLDPACGDGELLAAIREKCPDANLVGFDLDQAAIATARGRLDGQFERRDFLNYIIDREQCALFFDQGTFDIVIANPPYVRTQVLGSDRSQELAMQFELKGRVDIYFAFLEGIASVLRPGGLAGVIVSNRFMTTKAGETVRSRIQQRFDILHVWDLGDTRLFEAAVLPAVLLLRRKGDNKQNVPRMSSIYTTREPASQHARSLFDALELDGRVGVNGEQYMVRHGVLNNIDGIWRIGTNAADQWLETVRNHTYCTFGDIGKIRVGVKTTADKVFVKSAWDDPKPELLRPLVTHEVARRYRSLPSESQILYPHTEDNGRKTAVDLSLYPVSRSYLESNRALLEKRTYVTKAGRKWFEIWVPHRPSLWNAPKLVFPDISEKPVFWMSLEDEIIQGDCYWLTCDSGDNYDLLWLALAVANSEFMEQFYDYSFHNKLYSGRRRFMTQYVEKFPLPDPTTQLARHIIATARQVYEMTPSDEAVRLGKTLESDILGAFGLE